MSRGRSNGDTSDGLIFANLGVEQDLAVSLPQEQRPRGGPTTLPRRVLEAVSAFGTLMRAVARPGDRLWLPMRVTPQCLAEVPGLPKPELVQAPWPGSLGSESSVPRADRVTAGRILPWGESRRVVHARALVGADLDAAVHKGQDKPPSLRLVERPPTEADLETLWSAPPPSPNVVARVCHRGFARRLAHDLGLALPDSMLISGLDALRDHIHHWPDDRRWVLKDPLSAAGRGRLWGDGPSLQEPLVRAVTKRFRRWPELLFEPWVDRIEDFGVSAWLDGDTLVWWGLHRQLVDSRGGFQGVELQPSGALPPSWTPEVAAAWRGMVLGVGRALAAEGYRGPFGIDGYSYRRPGGGVAWQTLGEINPRWTFGAIAHWLTARLAGFRGWNEPIRLRLAVHHGGRLGEKDAPPRSPWQPWLGPLVLPMTRRGPGAWLETGGS